jgi:DnaJ-class molecular chaperone with C-terminal Zn finger domain
MPHASRLQLIHFLFGIAKADAQVVEAEVQQIKTIAGYLYISDSDFESIKAMFYKATDNAYTILEIDKTASVTDIKKAYRKMVKKYHPDKLRNLGDAHLKGAQEKFRAVQNAYEQLKAERNF